ncbi:acyltransferase family protein [Bradyrhizobium arachidis]|uniref:Acyltransferase n=1 Tax=Bradyrhizobium arachidis TaxID=858423 RepID=A0AAE7NP67_9BRAD|nr:acyltransferase [Bradyrhizobium arachidis]QOZ66948.1 acyltransferase [Bradyrhizobium arachidis]SFV13864.1 Peptidoglycan/LPS O-acetylase OafA/YrhL, contains acyltransferase and SGNH-hydrolase domains [Bradyrhizobium arachidis]
MHRIVTIQYLRAVAATGVVVHHFIGPAYFDAGLKQPPSIGEAGVDLFFVISGFIMWTTTGRRQIGPQEFMWHRILRIVPLYWLFTLAYFLITLASKHSPISPLDVIRSLFFIPWFDGHLSQRISAFYFLGWTLMYEMFFYCVFAVTLTLPRALQFKAIVGCLSALIVVGILFDFKGGMSFAYTSPLLLEFMAGCIIGRIFEANRTAPKPLALVLIGGGLIVLVLSATNMPDNLLERALTWGLSSALIVMGILSFEFDAEKHPSNTALLLGNASYSVYLSHIIILLIFNLVMKKTGIIHGFGIDQAFSSAAAFYGICGGAVALLGGVAVYQFIERPLSKLIMLGLAQRRPSEAPVVQERF